LKLTDAVETFFDINDVRQPDSPGLAFYAEYSYRWTRSSQRRVEHWSAIIPSNVDFKSVFDDTKLGLPIPAHDDYLLKFHDMGDTWLTWSEQKFDVTAHLVHLYWHSHHEYTSDSWVVSAHAAQLGLHLPNAFVKLQAGALEHMKSTILANLTLAQSVCLETACRVAPLLRCSLNLDRWEQGTHQERYHAPHCNGWHVQEGDVFTLVSFHKPQQKLRHSVQVWMHTVFYALFV